jgi:hypothetical protein
MIVEITFWIAVVAVIRKIGTLYARSRDVLYGAYVAGERSTMLANSGLPFANQPVVDDIPFFTGSRRKV